MTVADAILPQALTIGNSRFENGRENESIPAKAARCRFGPAGADRYG